MAEINIGGSKSPPSVPVQDINEVGELEESSNPISKSFVREFSSTTSPQNTPIIAWGRTPPPKQDQSTERSISLSLLRYDVNSEFLGSSNKSQVLSSSYHRMKSDSDLVEAHTTERRTRDRLKGYNRLSSPQQSYEEASYRVVDSLQREELETLLKKESSWTRSCLHKGLVANILFFIVMVIGIVLGEVLFPLEGVRGNGISFLNDTVCMNNLAGCITVRVVRATGIFGFVGGISNWIAIEMLFRSIPLLIGTGVIAKQYKEIRESVRQIVVETLFDPMALKEYFTDRKKSVREMLLLENHFGSLLNSDAANQIIECKIDSALARPEGFVLSMMGVDHNLLKTIIRRHIQLFITEISPAILDKMAAPGLTDGVGLQAEVEKILEEKIDELSSNKTKQLIAVMIRKHLSWLIVWGNIFGALIGIIAEVVTIVIAKYVDNM